MNRFARHVQRTLAILALGVASTLTAHAATTTNYTDQWGTQNENGWGLSVLQQDGVLFIDMFVFGPDGKPTWYVVGAQFQGVGTSGDLVFSGDLYAVTGPYFGAPSYSETNVNGGKVGTFTFDAGTVNSATVTYNVGAVTVVKNVQRIFWSYENFTGTYHGGMVADATGCTTNGHQEKFGNFAIAQTPGDDATLTFTMTPESSGAVCTYTGAYSQAGHLGAVTGTYSCDDSTNGTFSMFEMEKTVNGMNGRFSAASGTCAVSGRLGGVLR
ncbi:MAG: hypothetical protein JSR18_02330 [Proteobacteria bacterium]|nr:hypothetical protein [Pseudomonadota bacterium]